MAACDILCVCVCVCPSYKRSYQRGSLAHITSRTDKWGGFTGGFKNWIRFLYTCLSLHVHRLTFSNLSFTLAGTSCLLCMWQNWQNGTACLNLSPSFESIQSIENLISWKALLQTCNFKLLTKFLLNGELQTIVICSAFERLKLNCPKFSGEAFFCLFIERFRWKKMSKTRRLGYKQPYLTCNQSLTYRKLFSPARICFGWVGEEGGGWGGDGERRRGFCSLRTPNKPLCCKRKNSSASQPKQEKCRPALKISFLSFYLNSFWHFFNDLIWLKEKYLKISRFNNNLIKS